MWSLCCAFIVLPADCIASYCCNQRLTKLQCEITEREHRINIAQFIILTLIIEVLNKVTYNVVFINLNPGATLLYILCTYRLTYYSSYTINRNLARPPWGREGLLFPSIYIYIYIYIYISDIYIYLETFCGWMRPSRWTWEVRASPPCRWLLTAETVRSVDCGRSRRRKNRGENGGKTATKNVPGIRLVVLCTAYK